MRDCFSSDYYFCFGELLLIVTLDRIVITNGKVRRFYECPGQILVSIFGIGTAFLFAIAVSRATDTTTVRGIMTHSIKSFNVTGFQHDRQRQSEPNSIYAGELYEFRREF